MTLSVCAFPARYTAFAPNSKKKGEMAGLFTQDAWSEILRMTTMRTVLNIVWLILSGGLGLACLTVAFAAFTKSHDVAVVRNGFQNDYWHLAELMGGFGAVLLLVAAVSLYFSLRRRPTPKPPSDHF